ncbi:CYTH and CHAD domain-containing protein [Streptomyces scabiei]|uniref:CYTH and CHAD domain-containing protein n=1 Tax=Streptomyces scabiei TaxID=1930 RepID=UPI001B30BFB4|nr:MULTISPECIES: CYTH and CHAD domain-containing protein [Streptomyces]MBP5867301.1 CYTH and CHAD domain-containing protein [Streptomyces sp. LBUM 1485]MBP5875763.1 CYTH and CHAD domain-containing protein [Streptomyces sp. LBUM 1477]MBP5883481.1 CYTH and CHAD domain-containing protein [Streptomyces sp. LBUM 1487]MBP5893692.1 CYTH and CHAD domain-containing protein [Streptomyces sp. LBUM 1481]MBP5899512.1 CYTH and CHAD domain-containing protein [Streptomyces sp. LBUM 1488]
MADTKREIERKYESDESGLPDLTGVTGVATVVDKGVAELDAVYYDTPDERLAAAAVTLRRRTGGSDAGWHLKLPVSAGVRDEIRAPLSDTLPDELAGLVRSRVRGADLVPLVRLLSTRDVSELLDADGTLLAEVSVDAVVAERLTEDGRTAQWSEIEVELADDGDPAFLDKVEKKLRKAGVRPSDSPSKLARALRETAPRNKKGKKKDQKKDGKKAEAAVPGEPVTPGDHVLAYIRVQRDAIVELDPAVRRDVFDSVHSMRVATRRLRSTFKSFGKVLDRTVTDPIGEELKWLAGELGVDRDREVLTERLTEALDALPETLVTGPVHARLRSWSQQDCHTGPRRELIDALDGPRYLALLTSLDAVLADPPLLAAAEGDAEKVITKAVRKDVGKVAALVEEALAQPPGADRDLAMHEARKKTKRTRYAAEAAQPLLGKPAKALVKDMKSLQSLLGDHQDSVMARETLRDLAHQAHAAPGESAFTYGVLYGREERRAERAEEALPSTWAEIRDGLPF